MANEPHRAQWYKLRPTFNITRLKIEENENKKKQEKLLYSGLKTAKTDYFTLKLGLPAASEH